MSRDLDDEEARLRSAALQNAQSILHARRRAEQQLLRARDELEAKTRELDRTLALTRRAEDNARFLAAAGDAIADLSDAGSALQKLARHAVPHFADWCAIDLVDPAGTRTRVAVAHVEPALEPLVQQLDWGGDAARGMESAGADWSAAVDDAMLVERAKDEAQLAVLRRLGPRSFVRVPLGGRERVLGLLTFVHARSGRAYDEDDVRTARELARRAVLALENAELLLALRESDRRKDEFLAMLAHELRNPLAPIANATQIVRALPAPAPELRWAMDVIERQVHQMTRLVDDLLDVSRITRGRIELRRERVEVRTIVNMAVEACRPLLRDRGHDLRLTLPSTPLVLDVDPTRLTQVLLNLLTNAAKYMDPGGRVDLVVKKAGGHAEIRVRDDGIGIAPDMLAGVFDMFRQEDSALDRSRGGLGIGLTLARRLVELHGGAIEAKSEGRGRGSEFLVVLPLAAAPAEGGEPGAVGEDRPPPPGAPRRILVVDDNRDAADSLARLLTLLGQRLETAHDGLEALEAFARFRPEIVLLDLGMPRLDGYETARRLRAMVGGGEAFLVALTGWGQEDDRRRSREAGFDEHLTKPVEIAALQRILVRAGDAGTVGT